MRADASKCRRCDLYRDATQVVFGEGPDKPRVVLVGEQPGDREDRIGRPFVGPAGRVLDSCLAEAGVDRSACYLTNAVKHFKFSQRGKRRIHKKPSVGEVRQCAWWLGGEIEWLEPTLLVALGATATFALFGRRYTVMADRGRILKADNGAAALITVHPSSLLRNPARSEVLQERIRFISELSLIPRFLTA